MLSLRRLEILWRCRKGREVFEDGDQRSSLVWREVFKRDWHKEDIKNLGNGRENSGKREKQRVRGWVLVDAGTRGQETGVWAGPVKERPGGGGNQHREGSAHLWAPHAGSLTLNPIHRLLPYTSIPRNQVVWLSLKTVLRIGPADTHLSF